MARTIELNKPSVQTGADWVLKLPVTYFYEKISLILTNITLANITNIELTIRSNVVWRIATGTMLNDLNTYYGRNPQSGTLDFWFKRPEMENSAFAKMFGLGTADVDFVSIKFRLASGLTNPDIKVLADVGPNQPLGLITKIKQYQHVFAAAGTALPITDWPTQSAAIAAITFNSETDLDAVKISAREGATQKVGTVGELKNENVKRRRSHVSGYTVVDWLLDGNPQDAFQTEGVVDFKAEVDIAAAVTLTSTVEYFDTLPGL